MKIIITLLLSFFIATTLFAEENTYLKRPFYGQSPYLVNLNLNYSNEFFDGSL